MRINNQTTFSNKPSFSAFVRPQNLSEVERLAMDLVESNPDIIAAAREFDIVPTRCINAYHPETGTSRFFSDTPEGQTGADKFIKHCLSYDPPVKHEQRHNYVVTASKVGSSATGKAMEVTEALNDASGKPISSEKLSSNIIECILKAVSDLKIYPRLAEDQNGLSYIA